MSEYIEIDGIKLLPIKDAAEAFLYSRDHVARLARERKIVATQIGRQWYVDPLSLRNFSEVSDIEASVRKQQLSLERKKEKILKDQLLEVRTHFKNRSKKIKSRASMAALSVLMFGLIAGTGFYSVLNLFPDHSKDVSLARVISNTEDASVTNPTTSDFKVINSDTDLHKIAVVKQVEKIPVFTEETDIRFLSNDPEKGILILPKVTDEDVVVKVNDLFSDYLIVNFVDEDRGVIVYDKEGESVELSFVSVPVDKSVHEGVGTDSVKDINL